MYFMFTRMIQLGNVLYSNNLLIHEASMSNQLVTTTLNIINGKILTSCIFTYNWNIQINPLNITAISNITCWVTLVHGLFVAC